MGTEDAIVKAVAVIAGDPNVKGSLHFFQDATVKRNYGARTDEDRHDGDLGNIFASQDGVAEVRLKDMQIPLTGPHSILGTAVVVHADTDYLGRGGHELNKTTGNSGARVACGVIGDSVSSVIGLHVPEPNSSMKLSSSSVENAYYGNLKDYDVQLEQNTRFRKPSSAHA